MTEVRADRISAQLLHAHFASIFLPVILANRRESSQEQVKLEWLLPGGKV